jgi:putative DNA primase/helicase
MNNPIDRNDIERQFRDAALAAGISLPNDLANNLDGRVHRFIIDGKKDGAYQVWPNGKSHDGKPHGWVQDWHNVKIFWQYHFETSSYVPPTPEEITARRKKAEADRQAAAEQQRKATESAAAIWQQSRTVEPGEHPYLTTKGIAPYGDMRLSLDGARLVLPWRNISTSQITTIQTISADGSKRWHSGAPKRGGYLVAADVTTGAVVICEGAATAISVYEALQPEVTVISAGDSGALRQAASAARERWPGRSIFIAADDDYKGERKHGRNAGRLAAQAVLDAGLADGVLTPLFPRRPLPLARADESIPETGDADYDQYMPPDWGPSDWNDHATLYGIEMTVKALKRQIDNIIRGANTTPKGKQEAIMTEQAYIPPTSADDEGKRQEKMSKLRESRIVIDENTIPPHLDVIGGFAPRGHMTFISAQQGKGKSWLVERIAADLSLGGEILDGFKRDEPVRKVMFFTGESRWGQFLRRANQMRWNVTQIAIYDHWEIEKSGIALDIDTPEGKDSFEMLISMEKPDIVFLDSFFGFHNSDENKAESMKPLVYFLNGIAEKYNLAFVISHHNRKRKAAEQKLDVGQDDMIGSSMLHKNAAVILMLQSKTVTDSYGAIIDDAVLVKCEKSWIKKPRPFAFKIEDEDENTGDTHRTSMRIILNPDTGGTKIEHIIDNIQEKFDVGIWFGRQEAVLMCKPLNANEKTVQRALEEMQSRGLITDNGEQTRKKKYTRTGK